MNLIGVIVNVVSMILNRFFIFVLGLLVLVPVGASAQDESEVSYEDSLVLEFYRSSDDAERLRLASDIAYAHFIVDSVVVFSDYMISIGNRLDSLSVVSRGLSYKAWAFYVQGEYAKASEVAYEGIVLADSIGSFFDEAKCYHHLGNAYSMLRDASTANACYHKSISLYEAIGMESQMSGVLRSMAQVDIEHGLHAQAQPVIEKAVELDMANNNLYGLAVDFWIMGYSDQLQYSNMGSEDVSLLMSAKDYSLKAVDYATRSEDPDALVSSLGMLIDVLEDQLEFTHDARRRKELTDSCRALIGKAITTSRNYGLEDNNLNCIFSYVRLLLNGQELTHAKRILDSLDVVLVGSCDQQANLEYLFSFWADYYDKAGKYQLASDYRKKHHDVYAKNRRGDYVSKSAQNLAQVKFDLQMKRKEREALERELSFQAEAQRHFIVMVAIAIILLLVSILAFVAIRNSIRRHRLNRKLDEKNAVLELQKEEILVQNENLEHQRQLMSYANKQITDSINSALLIQQAALPSADFLSSLFGEHFVFFRPKDIVSGDFYWASRMGTLRLLVVADCTGHGVPGAFVSMLGISMLNDIVAKTSPSEDVSAGRLLDELRRHLKSALHQQGDVDEDHHGMDLSLIILDPDSHLLQYAGAFRPLYLNRGGLLSKVQPDRMPIGVHPLDGNSFTNHVVELAPGDIIYLLTDGIVDQFGCDTSKRKEVKFSSKRLEALLQEVGTLSCDQQCERIGEAVDSWRRVGRANETEQTDDMLIVGVRI